MRNHTLNLLLKETTPVDPILAQLVQEGFLPKIILAVMEEFPPLMGGHVICKIQEAK